MPAVTTTIDADGAVSVTVESDADDENLASTAIQIMADESARTAVAAWLSVRTPVDESESS